MMVGLVGGFSVSVAWLLSVCLVDGGGEDECEFECECDFECECEGERESVSESEDIGGGGEETFGSGSDESGDEVPCCSS